MSSLTMEEVLTKFRKDMKLCVQLREIESAMPPEELKGQREQERLEQQRKLKSLGLTLPDPSKHKDDCTPEERRARAIVLFSDPGFGYEAQLLGLFARELKRRSAEGEITEDDVKRISLQEIGGLMNADDEV